MTPYQYSPEMNHRLFMIRKALHITQKEMADEIGITPSHLSSLERKPGTKIEKKTVISICKVWQVNYNYLVHGTDPMFDKESARQQEMGEAFGQLTEPFQDLMLEILGVVKGFEERMMSNNEKQNDIDT